MPKAKFPREHRAGHSRVDHKGGDGLEGVGTHLPLQGFQVSLSLVQSQGGWLATCARGENSLREGKSACSAPYSQERAPDFPQIPETCVCTLHPQSKSAGGLREEVTESE